MNNVRRTSRAGSGRPGTVLMSVLVVVAIAAMVGTTVMYVADAEVVGTRTTIRAMQSRALAWSGVQVTMAELLAQRGALLDGGHPDLTRELTMSMGEAGARGVARLVEVAAGEAVVPEAGKLDLNTATAAMLVATGRMDEALAGRIVSAAAQRPLTSVEELLGISGVTAEMVYGVVGGTVPTPGPGAPVGGAENPAAGSQGVRLGDVLTTYAFDPNVQAGVGDRGADHKGKRRINIGSDWSDALGKAVSNRFGKDAAKVLEQVMKGGSKFAGDSDVVAVLRRLNVPPAEWGPILDSFTTTDDEYVVGRVDLSSASAAVLACVPGISSDAAAQIVRERDALSSEVRRSVAWPVVNGILTEEQFQAAVDHLTTRCTQWRVRVEAGYLKDAASGFRSGSGSGDGAGATRARRGTGAGEAPMDRGEEGTDGPLSDRVVYEAVIDVSSRRPRVAYFRDVTVLPGAYAMYTAASVRQPTAEVDPPVSQDEAKEPPMDGAPEDSGLKIDAGLKFEGLDLSGGGQKSRQDALGADPTVSGDSSGVGDGSAGKGEVGSAASAPRGTGIPSGARDRRIGRWTTGAGGGGGSRR